MASRAFLGGLLRAASTASIGVPVQTTLQMHTVKAGVNYHF
jgi:hypothetical protein